MKTLIELRRRLNEILDEQSGIDKSETEAGKNYLENTRYIALQEEERSVQADIQTAERVEEDRKKRTATQTALRTSTASPGLEEQRSGARVHNNQEDKPFANFGEYLISVRHAAESGVSLDPRLQKFDLRNAEVRAASGMNETVLSDGGFLVAQDNANDLITRSNDAAMVLPKCRRIPLGPNSNGVKLPYNDETSRVNGSRWGGVRVYWADEADAATATKPKIGRLELNLKKVIGLCYATDDLLADASALGSYIQQAFTEEFSFALDDAVIRGSGAGTPLGILNAAATVSQAKETSQAAATIQFANIAKMKARLWARSWANAVWFVNQDAEPQLLGMTVPVKNVAGTENVGGTAAYLPPGGASDAPFGRLLGRPVIPIEQCATVGTVGDIMLVDLSQYLTIAKDMQAASSIHVRFIYDEAAFRFTYRIDGQPAWKTALTPANSSITLSPFVTLATRS